MLNKKVYVIERVIRIIDYLCATNNQKNNTMYFTDEVIEKALNRISKPNADKDSLSSFDETGYNISVNYCGQVFTQHISNEQLKEAYGQALRNNGKNL
jgi:hypothetical protein